MRDEGRNKEKRDYLKQPGGQPQTTVSFVGRHFTNTSHLQLLGTPVEFSPKNPHSGSNAESWSRGVHSNQDSIQPCPGIVFP
jgi:hypothetical protein